MNKAEFELLPVLLAPRGAREFLGCDERTLQNIRTGNPEIAVKISGMRHFRYNKFELARVMKFEWE